MTVYEIASLVLIAIVWSAVLSHRAYRILDKDQDKLHIEHEKASR